MCLPLLIAVLNGISFHSVCNGTDMYKDGFVLDISFLCDAFLFELETTAI